MMLISMIWLERPLEADPVILMLVLSHVPVIKSCSRIWTPSSAAKAIPLC
jgi:hypothetical protein